MKIHLIPAMKFSAMLVIALVSDFFIGVNAGMAQQACSELSNPTPGTKCIQKLKVEVPHVGYPKSDRADPEFTPPAGFYFLGFDGPHATSNNNGAANIEVVTRGADFRIQNMINDYDKQLNDMDAQNKSNVEIKGVGFGGQSQIIEKARWENQSRKSALASAQTNIDHIVIHAKAAGRCKKNILGACVDSVGGWYKGYVNIYLVYVGSLQKIESEKNQTLNLVRQSLVSTPYGGGGPAAPSQLPAQRQYIAAHRWNSSMVIEPTPGYAISWGVKLGKGEGAICSANYNRASTRISLTAEVYLSNSTSLTPVSTSTLQGDSEVVEFFNNMELERLFSVTAYNKGSLKVPVNINCRVFR